MIECAAADRQPLLRGKIPRLLPDLWWRHPIAELVELAPIEPVFPLSLSVQVLRLR